MNKFLPFLIVLAGCGHATTNDCSKWFTYTNGNVSVLRAETDQACGDYEEEYGFDASEVFKKQRPMVHIMPLHLVKAICGADTVACAISYGEVFLSHEKHMHHEAMHLVMWANGIYDDHHKIMNIHGWY